MSIFYTAIFYKRIIIVRMFLNDLCLCPTQGTSLYERSQWCHYQTDLHEEICKHIVNIFMMYIF